MGVGLGRDVGLKLLVGKVGKVLSHLRYDVRMDKGV